MKISNASSLIAILLLEVHQNSDKVFRGSDPQGKMKSIFLILGDFQKLSMGKDEKKTHSIFNCDQTNLSRLEIGGNQLNQQIKNRLVSSRS